MNTVYIHYVFLIHYYIFLLKLEKVSSFFLILVKLCNNKLKNIMYANCIHILFFILRNFHIMESVRKLLSGSIH